MVISGASQPDHPESQALIAKSLTPKQAQVYAFLRDYIAEHQHAPYIREVQEACRIPSYKSAVDRLLALERKGWIDRVPNKHRGIALRPEPLQPAGALAVSGAVS